MIFCNFSNHRNSCSKILFKFMDVHIWCSNCFWIKLIFALRCFLNYNVSFYNLFSPMIGSKRLYKILPIFSIFSLIMLDDWKKISKILVFKILRFDLNDYHLRWCGSKAQFSKSSLNIFECWFGLSVIGEFVGCRLILLKLISFYLFVFDDIK